MFDCAGLALWALTNYTVGKLSQPQHEPSWIWLLAGGTIICQHFTQWEVSSRGLLESSESCPSCSTQFSSEGRFPLLPFKLAHLVILKDSLANVKCLAQSWDVSPQTLPGRGCSTLPQSSRDAEQASKHDIQSHTETFPLNCQAEAGRI